MTDRTSEAKEVNEARKQLFTQKSRTLENMPPTKAALEQHIKRATYQANIWYKALQPDPQLPSPSDWGWVKEEMGWPLLMFNRLLGLTNDVTRGYVLLLQPPIC